jgi:uncharacterized protein (DUF1330 family)
MVAEIEMTNPTGFASYRAAVAATVAQHGGRFLAWEPVKKSGIA